MMYSVLLILFKVIVGVLFDVFCDCFSFSGDIEVSGIRNVSGLKCITIQWFTIFFLYASFLAMLDICY